MKKLLSVVLSLVLILGTVFAVPAVSVSAATPGFDLNGWYVTLGAGGTVTPDTTAGTVAFTGTQYGAMYTKVSNLEVGKTYDFSFDTSPTSSFQLWVVPGTETLSFSNGLPNNSTRKHIISVSGTTFSAQITPEVTSYWFVFRNETGTAATSAFTFSNFRFEEASAELLAGIAIADGTWKATNGTVTNNTNAHTVTATGLSYHSIYTTISGLTPNTVYELTFDMSANTGFKQLWMVPGSETLNLGGQTYPQNSSRFTATVSTSGTKYVAQFTANEASYHLVFRDYDATVTNITLSNFKLTVVRTITEAELAGNAIADGTWKSTNGSVTNDTTAHTVTATSLSYNSIYTTISNLTPNTVYELTFDMSAATGFKQLWMVPGSETLNLGGQTYPQNSSRFTATLSTSGTKFVATFTAEETSYHLVFRDHDATVTNITLSNFVLTAVRTLSDAEIAGKVVANSDWNITKNASGTVTKSSGKVSFTGAQSQTMYTKLTDLTVDKVYTLTFDISPTMNAQVYLLSGDETVSFTIDGTVPANATNISTVNGTVATVEFTSETTSYYIFFRNALTTNATSTFTFSNFLLEENDIFVDTRPLGEKVVDGDWSVTSGSLTQDKSAHTITVNTPYHCAYTTVTGLKTNTKYTFSCNYDLEGLYTVYFVNSTLEAPAFNDSVYSGNCSDIAQEISIANGALTFTFITDSVNSAYTFILKHDALTSAVTYSNFEFVEHDEYSNIAASNEFKNADWECGAGTIEKNEDGSITAKTPWHCAYTKLPTLPRDALVKIQMNFTEAGNSLELIYIVSASVSFEVNAGTGAYSGSQTNLATYSIENGKLTAYFKTSTGRSGYYFAIKHGSVSNIGVTYSDFSIEVVDTASSTVGSIKGNEIIDDDLWALQISGNGTITHDKTDHTLTQSGNSYQDISVPLTGLVTNTTYTVTVDYTENDTVGGAYVYPVSAGRWEVTSNIATKTDDTTNCKLTITFSTDSENTDYYLHFRHSTLENNNITYSNLKIVADKCVLDDEIRGAKVADSDWTAQYPDDVTFTHNYGTHTLTQSRKSRQYIYTTIDFLEPNTEYEFTASYTSGDTVSYVYFIPAEQEIDYSNISQYAVTFTKSNYVLKASFMTSATGTAYHLMIKHGSLSDDEITYSNFKLRAKRTWSNEEQGELIAQNTWLTTDSTATVTNDSTAKTVTTDATNGYIYVQLTGLSLNTTYRLTCNYTGADSDISAVYIGQATDFPFNNSSSDTSNNTASSSSFKNNYLQVTFETPGSNTNYWFAIKLSSSLSLGSITLSNFKLSIPGVTTINDSFTEWTSPSDLATYSIGDNNVTASATAGSIYTKITGLSIDTTYSLQFAHDSLDGIKRFMVFPASETLTTTSYWSSGYYNGKYRDYNYSSTVINSNAKTANIVFTTNSSNTSYYFVIELQSGISVTLGDWELSEFTDLGFIGTAVRRAEANAKQALRYKNTISANAAQNGCFGLTVKEYGSIAAKTNDLNDMPLIINESKTVGNASVRRGIAYNKKISKIYETLLDGTVVYTAALINIEFDNYSADYTVRPYIILTDGENDYTIYGNQREYSVYSVFKLIEIYGNQEDSLTVYDILDNNSTVNTAYLNYKGLSGSTNLSVYNNTVISDDYKGMSGTVYHSSGYITDDKTGRNYTDEQRETELTRLVNSGVKYCRTRFGADTIWNATDGAFDFNSSRMTNFINYCKALGSNDISVCIQTGWYLSDIYSNSKDTGADIYLNGNGSDKYGEQAKYSSCIATEYKLTGTKTAGTGETITAYYNRMGVAALRYGVYLANFIQAAREKGVDNLDYLIYFTEPSYGSWYRPEGDYANEYLFICKTIKNVLVASGYSEIKGVGPNQATISGLLEYVVTREPDLFDVLTGHFYPEASSISSDAYYSKCYSQFSEYLQVLKDAGVEGKEFWIDEFFAVQSNASREARRSAEAALQTAVGAIAAQQLGIENIILWQMFDQAWGDSTETSTEFDEGIHMCGTAPSLLISDIPYAAYYPLSLFMRFNSAKDGKSYKTSTGNKTTNQGVYVGAMEDDNGNLIITVINIGSSEKIINLNLEQAIGKDLYRYSVSSEGINPTADATPTDYSRVIKNVGTSFTDTILPYSVSVYTTK